MIIRLGRSPRERNSNDTLVFLTMKSHGERILVGYSPWGYRRVRHDLVTKQQQIHMYTYTHKTEYYSTLKKREILPCTTTRKNLEGSTLEATQK